MRRARLLLAGVLAISLSTAAAHAHAALPAVQATTTPYADFIAADARRFGIPAEWICAVMRVESGGDPRAVSPAGAMGLMQIMPGTWRVLRARYGLGRDPFDPLDNILAGAAFLREMYDRYGLPGFLAAYNAGPGRYEQYLDRQRPLPAETDAYVAALVPLVESGAIAGPVRLAAAAPLSWTQAPLFIMRSTGAEPAVRTSTKPQQSDTLAVGAVNDLTAMAPQSAELFVAISATDPNS